MIHSTYETRTYLFRIKEIALKGSVVRYNMFEYAEKVACFDIIKARNPTPNRHSSRINFLTKAPDNQVIFPLDSTSNRTHYYAINSYNIFSLTRRANLHTALLPKRRVSSTLPVILTRLKFSVQPPLFLTYRSHILTTS